MLGLAIDPAFATNRFIYTCFASTLGGVNNDVRVARWTVNAGYTALTDRVDIVTGIPVNANGELGRHSGCRLRFGPDGALWIGTGDAATGAVPQSKTSLGGKVLRVNRNGAGVSPNPGVIYPTSGFDPRIYNYGHRNVQGIAFRADGKAFSVEHGTDRDDEVNLLLAGANYGWDPARPRRVVRRIPPDDRPGEVPQRQAGRLDIGLHDDRDVGSHLRLGIAVGRLGRHARRRVPQGSGAARREDRRRRDQDARRPPPCSPTGADSARPRSDRSEISS